MHIRMHIHKPTLTRMRLGLLALVDDFVDGRCTHHGDPFVQCFGTACDAQLMLPLPIERKKET